MWIFHFRCHHIFGQTVFREFTMNPSICFANVLECIKYLNYYISVIFSHISHKMEWKNFCLTFDDSCEYFKLLRDDDVKDGLIEFQYNNLCLLSLVLSTLKPQEYLEKIYALLQNINNFMFQILEVGSWKYFKRDNRSVKYLAVVVNMLIVKWVVDLVGKTGKWQNKSKMAVKWF